MHTILEWNSLTFTLIASVWFKQDFRSATDFVQNLGRQQQNKEFSTKFRGTYCITDLSEPNLIYGTKCLIWQSIFGYSSIFVILVIRSLCATESQFQQNRD